MYQVGLHFLRHHFVHNLPVTHLVIDDATRAFGQVRGGVPSVLVRLQVNACVFPDGFEQGEAFPRARHVDGLALVFERRAAGHFPGNVGKHFLRFVHQTHVILIRFIEFHHGELGVMQRIHAFVAEAAVDLEDLLESPDDEAFEMQLGRDAQVEIAVEGVVMRDERARRGPARNMVQHGRLDLEKPLFRQPLPHDADNLDAAPERLEHLGIRHHIEVTLAIARLDVGQAVPFLGKRAQ